MNKCPECSAVLINQNKCSDCGWRKNESAAPERQCSACQKEAWINHGGTWYCGPCHEATRQVTTHSESGEAEMQSIKAILARMKEKVGL